MVEIAEVGDVRPAPVKPSHARGLSEVWSTVVVRSGFPGTLHAFSSAIGNPLVGSATGRPTHRGETNLHVANRLIEEDAEASGIEWVVPPVVGKEFLDPSAREDYHTRLLDVVEFARCAYISVHFGKERAFVKWAPIHKPITWGVSGARQQIHFASPVAIGKVDRLWVTVEFPGQGPRFGLIPREDGGYNVGLAAVLPVTFRFLEEVSIPPALALQPVHEILTKARALQLQIQDGLAHVERLLHPDPEGDSKLAAEVSELRKCFESTEEMIDVLRAVRQGIKTR